MPTASLDRTVLLPELRLFEVKASTMRGLLLFTEKTSRLEVCPRCATPSRSVYDRRSVRLRDQPLRGRQVLMCVRKRRFYCRSCCRPFTEPVPGLLKGYRTTRRYRASLLWACEHFSDLKRVRGSYRCSAGLLYRVLYEQLELKRRTRLYPWPKKVGAPTSSRSSSAGKIRSTEPPRLAGADASASVKTRPRSPITTGATERVPDCIHSSFERRQSKRRALSRARGEAASLRNLRLLRCPQRQKRAGESGRRAAGRALRGTASRAGPTGSFGSRASGWRSWGGVRARWRGMPPEAGDGGAWTHP